MGAPELRWVGHTSYVLRQGGTSLLVDPWLTGTAFDDGWRQYTAPRLDPAVRDSITHIWFSHEHPDHFSPPSLRAIPAALRSRITVLFTAAGDGRVVRFCKQLGFGHVDVIPVGAWAPLGDAGDGLAVRCTPHRSGDSYLAVRTAAGVVLNLNDCVIRTTREAQLVADEIGETPAVLLTQFSYANRVGDPADVAARARSAAAVLRRVDAQITALRPHVVIPFASFVWFCHDENEYMNDCVNRVSVAARAITDTGIATAVVLYPGECWSLDQAPPDWRASAARYDRDLATAVATGARVSSAPVALDALIASGRRFATDLRAANGGARLAVLKATRYLRPVRIEVLDLGRAVVLSTAGVEPLDTHPRRCDVAMSSSALSYFLEHRFGGSTLLVNARLQHADAATAERFYRFVRVHDANNVGGSIETVVRARVVAAAERRLAPNTRATRWVRGHHARRTTDVRRR